MGRITPPLSFYIFWPMKNYSVTGIEETKRVMFFDKLLHLDVRRYVGTGLDEMPYMVNINWSNPTYNFWDGKFFVMYQDYDKDQAQNEEHIKLTEWKPEDEAKEIIKGLYVEYVRPQEFCIEVGDCDLVAKVQELIKKYGI